MRRVRMVRGGVALAAVLLIGSVAPAGVSAQEPDVVSVATEGDIATLDPGIGYDLYSWMATHLVYDQLVTYDAGTTLVPGLATALPEISADALTYTFTLREGVPFVQDGAALRDVTAADVVWSIDRLLRPDVTPTPSPIGPAFLSIIEGADAVLAGEAEHATGIEALDERTVRFTLTHPDRTFLNVLAMPFASIVPEGMGLDSDALSQDPIGTGPYELVAWDPGVTARFERTSVGEGAAASGPAAIELRMAVSAADQLRQLEAGVLDVMGDLVPAPDWKRVQEDPALAPLVISDPTVEITYLTMDTSGPESPFADVRVRRAVNQAIDKRNLVRLLNGRALPATCIQPPPMPGHDPACDPYPYDPDAARAAIAEALPDGVTTELVIDPGEITKEIAESIVADLAAAGITTEIRVLDWDALYGTISTPHAAPMTIVTWTQDFPDPSDFIDPLLSCDAAVEGGNNFAWYCDPAVDARSAELRANPDLAAVIPGYQELERTIMDAAPWAPLLHIGRQAMRAPRVTGLDHLHPVWFLDLREAGLAG